MRVADQVERPIRGVVRAIPEVSLTGLEEALTGLNGIYSISDIGLFGLTAEGPERRNGAMSGTIGISVPLDTADPAVGRSATASAAPTPFLAGDLPPGQGIRKAGVWAPPVST
jgi:hypothetical protein